jgi:hypothetical protein
MLRTTVVGTVESSRCKQQTNFGSGEPHLEGPRSAVCEPRASSSSKKITNFHAIQHAHDDER